MNAPFINLTVPLDASAQAEHAVDYAIAIAQGTTTLHFCSVVNAAGGISGGTAGAMVDPLPLLDALEANATRVCDDAVAKANAAGLTCDGKVLFGSPAREIARFAHRNHSDGIFICTHARMGFLRVLAGSVAEELLATSTVPVIVAHVDDAIAATGPITVALDGSGASTLALTEAIKLALAGRRSLSLLHVVQTDDAWGDAAPILSDAADLVRDTNLDFELVTLRGEAAATIVESAAHRRSSMIVMGTRGRSGLARAALGSVAAGVVERARMPVVVERQP